MNWLQQLLISTLLVLVVVLVVQNQRIDSQLKYLYAAQAQTDTGFNPEDLKPLLDSNDEIKAYVKKTSDEKLAKVKKDASDGKQLAKLTKALSDINRADSLRLQKQGKAAAEKIKATKKVIWQSGDYYTKHKKKLQSMMQPIDKLVGAWNSGDTSKSPKQLQGDLEAIIGGLGK